MAAAPSLSDLSQGNLWKVHLHFGGRVEVVREYVECRMGDNLGDLTGAEPRFLKTLEIRIGHGTKPDAENAYDAHATQANLRSRLLQGH